MDEPRSSSSTTRRRDHYNSQRTSTSRPSTANTNRRSYRHPDDAVNLSEFPVPPLKDPNGKAPPDAGARPPSRNERNVTRASDETYDLTEVAAPRPVRRDEPRGNLEDQHYLADDESRAGEEESSGSTPPQRPGRPSETVSKTPAAKETPGWLTTLYTVSYLIFFAMWGTLARLGVQWLTFYPGTPIVTPVIWANFAGSFIMGFLAEDQALFRISPALTSKDDGEIEDKAAHTKRKKTIPLYIGLATGFCGSFTSFSSFARDAFLAVSNDLPTPINHPITNPSAALISSTVPRNGGYSFQAWLHIILVTLALSIGGLLSGAQVAVFLSRWTPTINASFAQKYLNPAMVVLAWGCWLGALFLAVFPPDRGQQPETWRGEALFAILFAPVGCLMRWYLSLKLNGLVPSFPLGTFAVNMFGTAVLGMCFDLQHARLGVTGGVGGGITGCQVLQGVEDGFCGCLTTVSTWVAEINGLKRKHGWLYALASVIGALGLLVVIMGSVRWSIGWRDPVCATGYTGKVSG